MTIDLASLRRRARTSVRFTLEEPLRYHADLARAQIAMKSSPVRVLLVGDHAAYTSEQQFAPLLATRDTLLRTLRVAFNYQTLSEVIRWPRRKIRSYDVVAIKLSFVVSNDRAFEAVRFVREAMAPHAKLAYFDGDDDSCVLFPEVLPLVDLYVVKHRFKDPTEYRKERIGKSNLTDYVARTYDVSFADNLIPKSYPIAEDQLHKLELGWNIALDDKIRELFNARPERRPTREKDIDVLCRASVPEHSWLYHLRSQVTPKLQELSDEYRVLTPSERVPQDVYYEEMLRSRVCVSPFGYGEICWRDFEAVICGCVVVKPDMSHIDTQPDIFVPEETYVPVAWDYSNLGSTLRRLLQDPDHCERLRTNAFRVLSDSLRTDWMVERVRRILRRLDLHPDAEEKTKRD